MMIKSGNFLFFLLIVSIWQPWHIEAGVGHVTIINPVRISVYNPDPRASIKAQYAEIEKLNFPATWLVTYDVLDNLMLIDELKKFDPKQEFGLFLEVSENFASKSGVLYHKTGSWHFANAVLLSGYSQEERLKLIDTVFQRYKLIFGEYPSSVGSWWTDSFSLSYMKEKYQITADLGCSDQFATDNYSLWGQPWSAPYYPSKFHTGIPASKRDSIGILRLQWAPRDPERGYFDSLYSTQDYFTKPAKDIDYFKYLLSLYPRQVTIGLESDMSPVVYSENYRKQLQAVKDLGLVSLTMKEYANVHSDNDVAIVGSANSIWYQSSSYRAGVINGKMVDLRRYIKIKEPYHERPNRENTLFINIPSVFDYMNDKSNIWEIGDGQLTFSENHFEVKFPKSRIPSSLLQSPYFKVKSTPSGYRITASDYLLSDSYYSDWTIETLHAFRSRRFWAGLLVGAGWDKFVNEKYLIAADELVALNYLAAKPRGKVLIFDAECLQCEYHSGYRPAVFANLRKYIGKLSGHQTAFIPPGFQEFDRVKAREIIVKSQARYIYLSKYEDYIEKLPYSPGDLGIEKIYENANAAIWKIVK